MSGKILDVGSDDAPFAVLPYSQFDAGYPVYRTWSCPAGRSGCREASFVDDTAAHDYARYRNAMFDLTGTTALEAND